MSTTTSEEEAITTKTLEKWEAYRGGHDQDNPQERESL